MIVALIIKLRQQHNTKVELKYNDNYNYIAI